MQHKRLLAAIAAAGVVSLAVAPGTAAPPRGGLLVPGVSLGGVRLGMTGGEVLAAWGRRHGVCRNCERPTWYFNYAPFAPEGAGVSFRGGRVAHVFTVWKAAGWRTVEGLELGARDDDAGERLVILDDRRCDGYTARIAAGPAGRSVLYLFRGEVWGFGLVRRGLDPCL